jgi:hypothetical protein
MELTECSADCDMKVNTETTDNEEDNHRRDRIDRCSRRRETEFDQ